MLHTSRVPICPKAANIARKAFTRVVNTRSDNQHHAVPKQSLEMGGYDGPVMTMDLLDLGRWSTCELYPPQVAAP